MSLVYRLTSKTLALKKQEQSEDVVLVDSASSIRVFNLVRAKAVGDVGKTIYLMPSDTVSILQTVSRTKTGEPETSAVKSLLGDTTRTVFEMSAKMVTVLTAMEQKAGQPIIVVFAKRENGNLFLAHQEPLHLSVDRTAQFYSELLSFASPAHRRKILNNIPIKLGSMPTEKFNLTNAQALCKGTSASPGLVIVSPFKRFVAETTSPADVAKMKGAEVIITGGGPLSHAALLSASAGIPCVVGVSKKHIDIINEHSGYISVDAYSGHIYLGSHPIIKASGGVVGHLKNILTYAREHTSMTVLANADSAASITASLEAGAQGIGLYRTEHMYQNHTSLLSEYMLNALASHHINKRAALSKLLTVSTTLFTEALAAVESNPITIRLLDAPLSEFVTNIKEQNSMLGLRGCRFGIMYSDFYVMQVQAIAAAFKKTGKAARIGIMLPLISEIGEVIVLRDLAARCWMASGGDIGDVLFGAMIETPRACLISGELATYCDFLSYGTNDLTQLTFGISRDDATYLPGYASLGVLEYNPFEHLDARGVGRLLKVSSELARAAAPDIVLGVCGNHAGDPESISLLSKLKFNYISCTQSKIPSAILTLVRDK